MFVIFYVADPVNSGSGKYIDLMTIKMWKKPNSSEILKWLLFFISDAFSFKMGGHMTMFLQFLQNLFFFWIFW